MIIDQFKVPIYNSLCHPKNFHEQIDRRVLFLHDENISLDGTDAFSKDASWFRRLYKAILP